MSEQTCEPSVAESRLLRAHVPDVAHVLEVKAEPEAQERANSSRTCRAAGFSPRERRPAWKSTVPTARNRVAWCLLTHGRPLVGGPLKEKLNAHAAPSFDDRQSPEGRQRSLTFEEIAALQGVGPIEDPNELVGGWPGEVDDGFEEAVLAWRRGERWPKE